MSPGPGQSDGANSRPLVDTVAETGPGIADDTVVGGELAPGELGADADAEVEALKRAGWAPTSAEEAEGEAEAHPS